MDQQINTEASTTPSTTNNSNLYTIQPIAGKGQGVISRTNIPKGTRILAEAATFKLPRFATNTSLIETSIAQSLRRLTKDEQRAFFALHNAYTRAHKPIIGITKTNALPLGPNAQESGLFLTAARLNHACAPNAQNTWNATLDKLTVHVVKDVAEGDEITISYLDGAGPRSARQQKLHEAFGFACACATCSLSLPERQDSDERQDEIAELDELVADDARPGATLFRGLEHVHTILLLLQAEGIADARVPRAYEDAFQIAVAHGDVGRARVFAERAYAGRVVCEGEDSAEVVRLRGLVERPSRHPLFGTAVRWRLPLQYVPLGMGEAKLEMWLWMLKDTRRVRSEG
ncbi:uncharacterized protein K452DRAFT_110241 [Aplosporella prunicola CBS 121167]|uniref:SET domain-containing protein n=1 Tax=Aplosporella prunicola CBS 121167 TaxID=1176127 RepID=A0A6A6B1W8_9PEZI|nr:uncharacterized protein K452DRAFT_110241 [Aplosporella prunicola CBS 121167]KAF2137363.1 hypothetical protein K452DRAFT_110241 [Aplosporella prunicola CBS 121167]